MPLGEIRAFLRAPSLERLQDYERRATEEFSGRKRVLRHLTRILKEELVYEVVTKKVSDQPYVSRSKRVYVQDLEPFITATFSELGAEWGADAAAPFVLYHGPVNPDEDGPVEVCVPRDDGDRQLPAGEVALTEISGGQCNFPEILGAYESVYRWAKENGREPSGPPREIYLSGVGEEERLQIALPLR